MNNTTCSSKTHYPAVWISDVHLGYKDCQAQYLLDFLNAIECDVLYLVGDIVDLWSMKRQFFWHPSHYDVLALIQQKAKDGTRVIYIPGNHDETFRHYANDSLFGIEVHKQYIHTTKANKRFLLLHGDDFDSATRYNKLISIAGDAGYDFLLFLNRWTNRIRRLFGGNYWSLASWIKARVHKAREAIDAFEKAAIHEAKKQAVDGIICGHIHHPAVKVVDGILYCNDGDWIESCTALVENSSGRIELLHWSETQKVIHSADISALTPKPAFNKERDAA
ncbi:UDP-2,3-diacylglucosamine diphosphatase [Pseudoalteromonas shioyasakiensis]|jgi:UDP-2,3-diacylglucosamine pyrophosphatase LpxH|uniref:UDP-2,3-diacylglucosamine diphosphatase n=1 Tax=Pseudoalteromonas TaxID=53246 RepID=UPI000782D015|nr:MULTISPECIES: UDP-2,3-diacylglucosamine diphosphatase [Pseudoalteromonas]MCP4954941.1 UDP-2,3-diacylglucosamine diphosphatase [Photobacterium aquimaris]KZY56446.1 UDP-2,3-diacylglucosamine hydrolase [Pseudoalteromonas shioyasakiensis]MCO6353453.1 UDP-2,3-diacylglucosamine diphosphatase [Pseudoalteromonas shioyasakiensis]MCO7206019.1 UDP-2,3-diacylglucosamine diphosphatase [Pseudoalteromonas sp. CnMc7-37]MCZ4251736.1 UDP-2,3-diacylglucosamine diphosphatase [Pseudoalteromonas shioyasakiensis]|tara:strand:+ start:288 stop:1121 length:834 start_codon:yes stop_codon:yes gene_type:complete